MASTAVTIKICDCDCKCCVDQLYSQIRDDPNLLQRADQDQFVHTLLHEAAGRLSLAVEIMNLRPSLGKKLNTEGLSPLHVAIKSGKNDVALALVKLDKQLALIKGKGGFTPLHYAAARTLGDENSQLELLACLLAECPESMGVLNNRQQSAVHVALENGNVKATELLVNWLVIVAKESKLSIKDAHGNTTLHVAARHCRDERLLKLMSELVKVNKPNKYGETTLDIAIHHRNGVAEKTLKKAGAIKLTERKEERIPHKLSRTAGYLLENHAHRLPEILTRTYYFVTKELTMEMRNAILVVAVLIATATYQGVLQPPGGVYSVEGDSNATNRWAFPTNTLAFISSTLVIIFVLPDRAFILILQACLIFMCISYLLALNFISYYNNFSRALDLVCGCILGVAFLMKITYYLVKAYYNDDGWLLRRLGVMISNKKARFFGAKDKDGYLKMRLTRMRKQYKLISKTRGEATPE